MIRRRRSAPVMLIFKHLEDHGAATVTELAEIAGLPLYRVRQLLWNYLRRGDIELTYMMTRYGRERFKQEKERPK